MVYVPNLRDQEPVRMRDCDQGATVVRLLVSECARESLSGSERCSCATE